MFKVVVVDDEVETRESICQYFPWSALGFVIDGQFDNGRAALEYILNNPVHVVLSDIKMPEMSGIELAKELYQFGYNAKVILLSAYTDFQYAKQALVYGVKDYVVKPSRYEELMEVFTRVRDELVKDQPTDAKNNSAEGNFNYDQEVISKVKTYLDENFQDATLEDAAALVKMNPSYLSYFFKQKTGTNFSSYLLSLRMQKAANYLKDVHNKIYDVSSMVGYSNPKNFTRTFRTYFGKTPVEFRRGIIDEKQ